MGNLEVTRSLGCVAAQGRVNPRPQAETIELRQLLHYLCDKTAGKLLCHLVVVKPYKHTLTYT